MFICKEIEKCHMKKNLAFKLKRYNGEDKEISTLPSQNCLSLLIEICFVRGEGVGFPLSRYITPV